MRPGAVHADVAADHIPFAPQIIANCKTLVNQGARAELSELFHYISMAETALGKLRSGRKFNRLSLAFDKDYDEAINFRKEVIINSTALASRPVARNRN